MEIAGLFTILADPGHRDNAGGIDPDPGNNCQVHSVGEHVTQPSERNGKTPRSEKS